MFSVYDVVGIAADRWYIDALFMDEQLDGREHSGKRPAPKICRVLETVAKLESCLQIMMENRYRSYCECNARDRAFVFKRPTMSDLAGMVGKNKSTVSDALEIKLPIEQRKYEGLTVLWEASQSWEATHRYGEKHFGALGRR